MTLLSSQRKQIKQFLSNSLAGYSIRILNHTDPSFRGLIGTITDESSNMLKINTQKNDITVSKISGLFGIKTKMNSYKISGDILVGTPEKRSKRKYRTW